MEKYNPESEVAKFNNWIKPDIAKEKMEFMRVIKTFYREDLLSDREFTQELRMRYENTALQDLSVEDWENLENTDSTRLQAHDTAELRDLIAQYDRKDLSGIERGLDADTQMEAPIIARLPDNNLHLVSGNTRLCTAKVRQLVPKVIIVDFPEEGYGVRGE